MQKQYLWLVAGVLMAVEQYAELLRTSRFDPLLIYRHP